MGFGRTGWFPLGVAPVQISQFYRGQRYQILPAYSPDLSPIEEFFAELKAFIKRNWRFYEECPEQGFDTFLEWCVDVVGAREESAKGHFRHAGVIIEEYD